MSNQDATNEAPICESQLLGVDTAYLELLKQKHKNFLDERDLAIDEGIICHVLVLREGGVETFESCQGGEGHPFPEPTIRFYGTRGAGFHAYSVAVNYGLKVRALRRVWDVIDGELVGPNWEMVFWP